MEAETISTSSSVEVNEEQLVNETVSTSSNVEVNEEQKANEKKTVEGKIIEPKIDMMFDSLQEVFDCYTTYAKKMGFAVSKRSCQRSLDDGRVIHATFACSRNGQSKCIKNTLRPHPISKTGCPARLNAALCTNEKWRISSIVVDHNHIMSPGKSRYYKCNRVLQPHIKRKLEVNDKAGIRMNKNYNSLVVEAGGHENLPFLEKDCRNYIEKVRRLRLGDGDAAAVQDYFTKMHLSNSNFFYKMDLDEEGRLKNMFWADARSRAAYEEFGDVVTFDTTYLTNKYDMPFAPFVGINHHGQSILLGCGLISSEDTSTFMWLFQSWLTCMLGRAPLAIITDQDKAMQNAIEVVFPNARHRWCLWHIMKKLPEKLKGYKEYEQIKFSIQNAVYDSLTPFEFEESWNWMMEKFKLDGNDWLIGLYNERHRWVPAFVKDSFWAGMSTTGRSESMNAFFDGYVNSKTTLKQFVEQYENALRSKVEKENLADFNSFNSWVPCITHYDMEKQLQEAYTTVKFREFQEELTGKMYCDLSLVQEVGAISEYAVSEHVKIGERPKRVNFKVFLNKLEFEEECEVKCSCRSFEFRGILCRHAISVLIYKDIYYIPAKYILQRWRKDLKRRHTKVKISYDDWSVKPEGCRFDRMCNAFQNTAYLAIESEQKYNMVMDWIHNLDEELRRSEGTCQSSQLSPRSNVGTSTRGEARDISKGSQDVLTPLAIRSKGRPPFKRKLSKVDQIIKKKKEKTKTESKEKKTIKQKRKKDSDSQIVENKKIGNKRDQSTKQAVDVIPTQESIVRTDPQITQNVSVYRSDGHHPSKLQFPNVPLHMGMPHLPIGMPHLPMGMPHLPMGMPMFHHEPSRFGPQQLHFGQGDKGYYAMHPDSAPGNFVFNRTDTHDSYSKSESK